MISSPEEEDADLDDSEELVSAAAAFDEDRVAIGADVVIAFADLTSLSFEPRLVTAGSGEAAGVKSFKAGNNADDAATVDTGEDEVIEADDENERHDGDDEI
jgi:hypothetical protein